LATSTTLDKTPVPLLPASPALTDHEMVLPLVFSARKFQVLLLRLAPALNVYTSFTDRELDPTTTTRNEPFHARSTIRAPPLLLFDRNQHVNAAVLPDEVTGNTTYDAPAAFRTPPANVRLPLPTGLTVENDATPPTLLPATPIVTSATPSPPLA
jgi:hypothetical protein